jgi:hypothetical protein
MIPIGRLGGGRVDRDAMAPLIDATELMGQPG